MIETTLSPASLMSFSNFTRRTENSVFNGFLQNIWCRAIYIYIYTYKAIYIYIYIYLYVFIDVSYELIFFHGSDFLPHLQSHIYIEKILTHLSCQHDIL